MKKQRRSDVTTEIVVGAFMFAVLLALVSFTIVLSQNRLFTELHEMTVYFENIGGLKEGEPVFMRGVKVGNVDSIAVADHGVNVSMLLEQKPDIREDHRFSVKPVTMLGGMKLEIYEGSVSSPVYDGRNGYRGEPVTEMMQEAAETIREIREILTDDGILDEIKVMSENLADVSKKINTGTGTVARLINDGTLYDDARDMVDNLNQSSAKFNEIVADVRKITERVEAGKGFVGKILSDEESLYNNLTNTVANVDRTMSDIQIVMRRIENGEGTIGKLLSAEDQLYQDLAKTMEELRSFSEQLNAQQGTLALLINEDVLYRKIVSLVDETRATIDDLRETSPITTFSSIFFGAF